MHAAWAPRLRTAPPPPWAASPAHSAHAVPFAHLATKENLRHVEACHARRGKWQSEYVLVRLIKLLIWRQFIKQRKLKAREAQQSCRICGA